MCDVCGKAPAKPIDLCAEHELAARAGVKRTRGVKVELAGPEPPVRGELFLEPPGDEPPRPSVQKGKRG